MKSNNKLKRRILDISYKHKLSHLGSCLTAVDIIDEIYKKMGKDDKFVLSQGHAGLALYVVLEQYFSNFDAEDYLLKSGIHPDRLLDKRIHCSTGSLGQGLPIALGMALASPDINVYCLISDGEVAEGSIWETLYYLRGDILPNFYVYMNANRYTGYGKAMSGLDLDYAIGWVSSLEIDVKNTKNPKGLAGLKGHYQVMDEKLYKQLSKMYGTP